MTLPAQPIRDPRARPACMTEAEWREWNIPDAWLRPWNPCSECPVTFAIAQRAIGACDGIPHGGTDDRGGRRRSFAPQEALARRRESWRASKQRRRGAA